MKRALLVSLIALTGCDFEKALETCVRTGMCEPADAGSEPGQDAGLDAGLDAGMEDAGSPDAGVSDGGTAGLCNTQGWCWQTITPRVRLTAVVTAGPNEAWAFGDLGVALHFDGTWHSIPGRTENITAAIQIDPQMLLVGTESGLFVLDGGAWTSVSAVSGSVTALGVDPAGQYFASTQNGMNWFRAPAGGSWSTVPAIGRAFAFTFPAPGLGWASSEQGVILAYADGGWRTQTTPASGDLLSVWATMPDDVFAGGAQGELLRRIDGGWTELDAGVLTAAAVLGASGASGHAWMLNDRQARFWDGTGFGAPVAIGDYRGLALSVSPSDDGWIVGLAGSMSRVQGSTWANFETGKREIINAIHGSGPDDIWAVGQHGYATHFDGTSWTERLSPRGDDLFGVFAAAPDDVWAVGAQGTIIHWNGTTWEEVTGLGANALESVWVDPEGTAFIVGAQGTFWSVTTSGGVQPHDAGLGSRLTDISGVGETLFVVGDDGAMVSCRTLTFECNPTSRPGDAGLQLNSVFAVSETDVWATAISGEVQRWDGTNWTQRSPQGRLLNVVRGDGSPDGGVFVAGELGHFRFFNNQGGGGGAQPIGANVMLNALYTSGGTTVVGGDFGALLLRKQ